MLQKTPKTAKEHGISEAELEALHWVRNALATGLIKPRHLKMDARPGDMLFDMDLSYCKDEGCGTVACIGGWMAAHMGMPEEAAYRFVTGNNYQTHSPLRNLFWPMSVLPTSGERYNSPEQAVAAIDRWLDGERDVEKLWPEVA